MTRGPLTRKGWRWISAAVLAAAALWVVGTAQLGPKTEATELSTAPQEGFNAPGFTLTTLDQDSLSLEDLRGQAVILNFWASWCPPCQEEMPAMQSVYETFKDQGLQIVAVNLAFQDSTEAAQSFVDELSLTFPVVMDEDGDVARQYRISALPTTFFIDAEGVVQEVVMGGPLSEALLYTRAESLLEGVR